MLLWLLFLILLLLPLPLLLPPPPPPLLLLLLLLAMTCCRCGVCGCGIVGQDGAVKLWDERGKTCTATLPHASPMFCVAWLQGAAPLLAAAGEEGDILVYDVRSPQVRPRPGLAARGRPAPPPRSMWRIAWLNCVVKGWRRAIVDDKGPVRSRDRPGPVDARGLASCGGREWRGERV